MSNSSQTPSNKGALVNSKNFQVIIRKRNGSEIALQGKGVLRGVLQEDYPVLPQGVVFSKNA